MWLTRGKTYIWFALQNYTQQQYIKQSTFHNNVIGGSGGG